MRIIVALLAAGLATQVAFAQPPDETTDVDETTTEESASPLDPGSGKAATVTDPKLRPDGERAGADLNYETIVLGAFRATQSNQGALDGRWHLTDPEGDPIYTIQITDPGAGEQRIEGAWRNLAQTGPGASGFFETIRGENGDVVLTFRDGPREVLTELRLRRSETGVWFGESMAAGVKTDIVANRAPGLETASMDVPVWKAPPPPKAKAKAKRKTNSRSKSKNSRRR